MIAIIVDNHAHRLLGNGAVESINFSLEWWKEWWVGNWQILSPEHDLNMTSGDFDAFIRKPLQVLCEVFPADRSPLPSSEKVEQAPPNENEVRG